MEFEFLWFISFFVGSISMFTSIILIFKGSEWPLNNRLMGLALLISNIYVSISFLVFSGGLIEFPYLFRVFAPVYYLIGPLLFFFFRGAVYRKRVIWNKDWFHFLPAIIQFIDLIPFYIKSNLEKR